MASRSMKTCKHCQESKARSRFTRDGRTRDGLRKVCEDCRQASQERRTASVAAAAAEETREAVNIAQAAAESFDDIVNGLETPTLPDIPWFLGNGAHLPLTAEQNEAMPGILIALLQDDAFGSKYLMTQVCETVSDVMVIASEVITSLLEFVVADDVKENEVRELQRVIGDMASRA